MIPLRLFIILIFIAICKCSTSQKLSVNCNFGNQYKKKGNFKKAIREYNKCISDNSDNAWLYNDRGICYSELKDQLQALKDFLHANSLEPNNKLIINNIGIANEMSDKLNEALPYYNMAIELDSNYTDPYFNKARTFEKLKQFDSAELNYKKVVAINTKDKETYIVLSMLYENQGKFEEAINMLGLAIDIDRNDPDLHYFRAIDFDTLQNYNLAIQDYNLSIDKNKDGFDYSSLCRRGKSKELSGDTEGALNDYSTAIHVKAKFKRAYLLRIKLFLKINENEKACQDIKLLKKLDKDLIKEFETVVCQ